MRAIDLHTHTCKSDGSYTPTELVDYAIEKNLAAVAITDHDSIEGLDEAVAHAAALRERGLPSVEMIPGIEFSTKYEKQDVHIVGLYISYEREAFQSALGSFVDSRVSRNRKMCENLQGAGIDITYEKLLAMYPDAVITRAHYASYLLEHGYVKSRQDAFARYLGDHTKYFVPRENPLPGGGSDFKGRRRSHSGAPSLVSYGKRQAGHAGLLPESGRAYGNRSLLQHLQQSGCARHAETCRKIQPACKRRLRFSRREQTWSGSRLRLRQTVYPRGNAPENQSGIAPQSINDTRHK